MKKNILFATVFLLIVAQLPSYAQLPNENTLSVMVNDQEYKTAPRRIKMGNVWYITANALKPDRMLRFWFINWSNRDIPEPGLYKIVDEEFSGEEQYKAYVQEGKYKGLAYVKYVEETKAPRMEYHVGESRRNEGGEIEIVKSPDGSLEGKFNATLDGAYFKEKAGATVLGGMSRLRSKLEDKVVTGATGYDSDIDPEGRGYRRMEQKDEIVLKNGTFKLKLKE